MGERKDILYSCVAPTPLPGTRCFPAIGPQPSSLRKHPVACAFTSPLAIPKSALAIPSAVKLGHFEPGASAHAVHGMSGNRLEFPFFSFNNSQYISRSQLLSSSRFQKIKQAVVF